MSHRQAAKISDAQNCQSFRCSHTQTMDIDEDSDQNLNSLDTTAYI